MPNLLDVLLWRCPPRPKLLPWWRRRRGHFVQRVRLGQKIKPVPASEVTLLLGDVDLSRIAPLRGVTPEHCAEMLKASLSLPRAAPEQGNVAVYRLDLAITEMRPLAWWLDLWVEGGRWSFDWSILGELGFGHGWLQVEGALWDDAKRPALEFAHRTRYPRLSDMKREIGELTWRSLLIYREGARDPLEVLCIRTAHAILQEVHATVAK